MANPDPARDIDRIFADGALIDEAVQTASHVAVDAHQRAGRPLVGVRNGRIEAIDKRGGLENIKSLDELRQAVIEGAVHRLRPKLLTEGVAIIAIFPMVFASGVGGEILAPMALPVLGGLLISDEVVDLFLPVRFYWIRRSRWLKLQKEKQKLE